MLWRALTLGDCGARRLTDEALAEAARGGPPDPMEGPSSG